MDIKISIANKHCTVQGTPVIVCGNAGYTVTFDFDAEWAQDGAKTARFSYVRNGVRMYQDVGLTGNNVKAPPMHNVTEVQIGVYAGDLVTTTPARIPCEKSIKCGTYSPDNLTPSQYEQLSKRVCPNVTTDDAGKFLRVSGDGVWEAQSVVNAEEVAY